MLSSLLWGLEGFFGRACVLVVGGVLVASLGLLPGVARAGIDSDLVTRGVAAYDALEYPRAVELLEQALRETLTREEKIAALRTLGFAHVALEQPDAARADFERLLRIAPGFELDRTISPRVRVVFAEVKARMAPAPGAAEPPAELPALTPTVDWGGGVSAQPGHAVAIRVDDSGRAVRGELFYRTRGQAGFAKLTAPLAGARFAATVPGMAVRAPALEYYLVLLDGGGATVASAGSQAQPLDVAVAAAATRAPVYKRGWFWAVIGGVAVVGAGVATAVVLTQRTSVSPSTPATITLQPQLSLGR
jgi:hypothetical protein